MSAKISGQVWDLDLPQRDMLVLLAMTDHANHEGVMWPGVALIAWKTGYSKRTVMRIMASLVKRGILIRRTRPGKETIYIANLDAAAKKPARPKPAKKAKSSDIAVTGDTAMSLVTTLPVKKNASSDTSSAKAIDEPSLKIEPSLLQRPLVFKAYEDAFGFLLTPMLADELKLLVEEYTEAWVIDAMRITVTSGKRSLGYAKAILRRWKADGKMHEQSTTPAQSDRTAAEKAAAAAELEREREAHRIREGLA